MSSVDDSPIDLSVINSLRNKNKKEINPVIVGYL